MNTRMHIVLKGLPERVQETADLLDQAFPGLMKWRRFAQSDWDHAVRLEGDAADQSMQSTNQTVHSGKVWKLSPKEQTLSKRSLFCASRS